MRQRLLARLDRISVEHADCPHLWSTLWAFGPKVGRVLDALYLSEQIQQPRGAVVPRPILKGARIKLFELVQEGRFSGCVQCSTDICVSARSGRKPWLGLAAVQSKSLYTLMLELRRPWSTCSNRPVSLGHPSVRRWVYIALPTVVALSL